MKNHLFPVLFLLIITSLLCKAQGPVLWGITPYGGTDSAGSIFSYNTTTSMYNVQFNCTNTTGSASNCSLIQASNGLLYGTTTSGGAHGYGTIFSYDIITGTDSVLHSFDTVDGRQPAGTLIQASNGLLYGTLVEGGIYDTTIIATGGTLFSYNIETGVYANIYYFGNSDTGGLAPQAPLIQVSDSLLYGVTNYGGIYDTDSIYGGGGTIFSYNIVTGALTVLHNFGQDTDGKTPVSMMRASNGLLYGLTARGGVNGDSVNGGTIFSYNIATGAETVLHTFGSGTDGALPERSLIEASDSSLYGVTFTGGTDSAGVIFSYNIASGSYAVLHNFGSGTDGALPIYSLTQASNELLYGTTFKGGATGSGIIYSYNISTGIETDVHNFDVPGGGSGLLEVSLPTAINPVTDNKPVISIYPNPSSGEFIIIPADNQNSYPAMVYNVLSEKIGEIILYNGRNSLNLNNQAPGIYFVNVQMGKDVLKAKLIIAK